MQLTAAHQALGHVDERNEIPSLHGSFLPGKSIIGD